MAYLLTKTTKAKILADKPIYKNKKGNSECVEFVVQTTDAPATSLWVQGITVKGSKFSDILEGTAIATFVDGAYPQSFPKDGRAMHAAIYLSHDDKGIYVLDQWNGQPSVLARTIRFDRADKDTVRRANAGENYSVVD